LPKVRIIPLPLYSSVNTYLLIYYLTGTR